MASSSQRALRQRPEFTHATGHPKRLNRESIAEAAAFGSPTYSFEELCPEMGAAYLCAERESRQAGHIAGWLKKLRDDRGLAIYAAAQAQRAADFVLKRTFAD
jgi:antirestriction protein ArdC